MPRQEYERKSVLSGGKKVKIAKNFSLTRREEEMKNKCDKECFANQFGKCTCLTEAIPGKCPFQRTDITMKHQVADITKYNSTRSVYGEPD